MGQFQIRRLLNDIYYIAQHLAYRDNVFSFHSDMYVYPLTLIEFNLINWTIVGGNMFL